MFWGGTFVAGRLLAAELHPLTAASLRFLLASAMLLTAILVRDKSLPRLNKRQWGALTLLGLTGVFAYNIFFFTGLQTIEAGRASMIIAVNPVITAFLAILFFSERPSLSKISGMLIAVCGALIVISRGQPASLFQGDIGGLGELCIVGCVLSWSAYTLIGKRLLTDIQPLVAVAYSCSIGALFLTIMTFLTGYLGEVRELSAAAAGSLFYFAFFGTTLGFIWFYDGVKKLGAGRAAMYINLVPVSGVLLGTLFLDERPGSSLFIGGALVFSGLYLINRTPAIPSLQQRSRLHG
ncbi:MAG: DMT family transporter [Desulfobulbaceae bacterium]|uniref:DMT family transporter n=1 Tax=Candidatus Desulfatifera sulfidica TaxID=2841691 RepID=A0A8J6NBS9_9BACT|nr:DMT family transporter [Candidatus Desulfatifera sulfidica]